MVLGYGDVVNTQENIYLLPATKCSRNYQEMKPCCRQSPMPSSAQKDCETRGLISSSTVRWSLNAYHGPSLRPSTVWPKLESSEGV